MRRPFHSRNIVTGILGGSITGTTLQEMDESLHEESWYEREHFEEDGYALGLVHHGEHDSSGWLTWQQGERAAVVHGAISNREESDDELFESLFSDPAALLARLDGPFVVAGIDSTDERVVVATDRLGTYPCYYHTNDGLQFASGLSPLLTQFEDPTLNEQAVSDMLLMGFVWGEKTLVDGIKALPPATVLEYDGEISTQRYWSPSFEARPKDGYLDEFIERYRSAIGDVSKTMDNTVGLWLSGGLDSRTLAAELARHAGREFDRLVAYTYDANPSGGGNPERAREVASALDIDIDAVELTPEIFLNRVGEAVDLTDGMLRWSSFLNLLSVYALPDLHAGVLLEGSGQGELMGQHPRLSHFQRYDSAAEGLLRSENMVEPDAVQSLMTADIDPRETFERSVARSDERTHRGQMLDAHYTNYYSRMAFASDAVARSQAGTRVPFVHGDLLEHAAGLPMDYRMRTLPLTNGKIPYAVLQTKLVLMRALDPELAAIPLERTGLPPTYPLSLQVAGFVATTALARLRQRTTYGGRSVPDEWYRSDPDIREFIDDLLRSACERSVFDGEEIRRLRREHLTGEANHVVGPLAAVTTLELWMQRNLD